MNRKSYLVSFIAIFCLAFFFGASIMGNPGLIACQRRNVTVTSGDWGEIPTRLEPGMTRIIGQVVSISSSMVEINTGVNQYTFPLAANIKFFCNGLSSKWMALKPVTPQAFFEATLILNTQNEVIFISGFYNGEICVIKSWRYCNRNLWLQLYAPDSGITCWRMIGDTAELPGGNWLEPDTEVYVLYSVYLQNIRAIFLPEG
jgi:hypothetical protein